MPLKLVPRGANEILHVRGTVKGQYCYETTGTADRALAEAFRAAKETELYEASLFGARVSVSWAKAAKSYLKAEPRSATTATNIRRLTEFFSVEHHIGGEDDEPARFVPKNPKLATIDQDVADEAVTWIVGDDAAAGTKNRGVYTPLIAVLNHAAWRGWCGAPRIKKKQEPRGKTVWLTPHQAAALMDAIAPHLRPLVLFGLCTGGRMSELVSLRWEDIDVLALKAVFRDTKNGTDREARLCPNAVAAVQSLPHREGIVFRTDDGEPYEDREKDEGGQIKTAWRTGCRRAGLIKWVIEDGKAAAEIVAAADGLCTPVRWVPTVTPHAMRHSFATYFYALTRDLLLLKDEGGWKDSKMCERYTHLMPTDMVHLIRMIWGDSHPRIGKLPTRAEIVQWSARA